MYYKIEFHGGSIMKKQYSETDLLLLIDLESEFHYKPNYGDAEYIAIKYNEITKQNRNSGSLYMAVWRINNGYYDSRYHSVAMARKKIS